MTAALSLLDRKGLARFSVRDLARELGVFPAAIYWHVSSRTSLLGLVASHVLEGVVPGFQETGWQAWLRHLFHNYRQAIRRHPNVAALLGARMTLGTGANGVLEDAMRRMVERIGFREDQVDAMATVVMAAVSGFLILEFAAPTPDQAGAGAGGACEPAVASVGGENGQAASSDDPFDLFTETFIAGLERMGRP